MTGTPPTLLTNGAQPSVVMLLLADIPVYPPGFQI